MQQHLEPRETPLVGGQHHTADLAPLEPRPVQPHPLQQPFFHADGFVRNQGQFRRLFFCAKSAVSSSFLVDEYHWSPRDGLSQAVARIYHGLQPADSAFDFYFHRAGGPHTHGGHVKRRPGSIGMRQSPGSVEKGHPMPGDTGNRQCTVQNLKVESVRPEQNLILVRGAVPGANGSMLIIRKAIKKA